MISFSCRGMECASDVSIQRRRICCTVIWIGDAQSTYLLNLFHFRPWQPAKPRTGKSNFIFFSAQLPQSAYFTILMTDNAASEHSSEQGRRKHTSHCSSRWVNKSFLSVCRDCLCTSDALHNKIRNDVSEQVCHSYRCPTRWYEPFGEGLSRLRIDGNSMSEFTLLN